MSKLREFWKALTEAPENPVSACSFGVPLRNEVLRESLAESVQRIKDSQQYGSIIGQERGERIAAAVDAQREPFETLQRQLEQRMIEAQDKAFMDAMQYGVGAFKIEHVRLGADNPEMIREMRTITTINPVSGIPTEDADRKRLQLWTYLIEYFPDSFLAEVEVAMRGNEQHNPGQPLHWARSKSRDQYNTAFRHLFEHGRGVRKDTDGQYHLAKAIWRLKAALQLLIEEERRANPSNVG